MFLDHKILFLKRLNNGAEFNAIWDGEHAIDDVSKFTSSVGDYLTQAAKTPEAIRIWELSHISDSDFYDSKSGVLVYVWPSLKNNNYIFENLSKDQKYISNILVNNSKLQSLGLQITAVKIESNIIRGDKVLRVVSIDGFFKRPHYDRPSEVLEGSFKYNIYFLGTVLGNEDTFGSRFQNYENLYKLFDLID